MVAARCNFSADLRDDSFVPALMDLGALEFPDVPKCVSSPSEWPRLVVPASPVGGSDVVLGVSYGRRLDEQGAFLGDGILMPAC